jgi:hypothetical protein
VHAIEDVACVVEDMRVRCHVAARKRCCQLCKSFEGTGSAWDKVASSVSSTSG